VLPQGYIGVHTPLDWQAQTLLELHDSPVGQVPAIVLQEFPQLSKPAVLPHGYIAVQVPQTHCAK
jgi:hypothetical protein